jgi:hypothetical protein
MTLEGRYGPASGIDAAAAAARIEAYERAVRAALTHAEGVATAPVTRLSDAQLAALFAPRQRDVLVARPLVRAPPECG